MLVTNNAYHILWLSSDNDEKQINKRYKEILNLLSIDEIPSYNSDVPFIVGMNQNGLIFDNIAAARHLLVAGTTGSGKSVFLHTLIYTMLCNPHNYIYLVDCKKVEFDIYRNNARVCDEVFGNESCC